MRIFISTGEPSGDLHAANLVLALRRRLPNAEFVGFGGPRLEAAGAKVLYPLVDLAVMWVLRVLLNLHKFVGVVNLAEQYFIDHRPDVVVLIDYPGLHWIIARRAKKHGIPVVYYVPPQIWAWAGWRVKKVRRFFDLVLCSLPFEPGWYHARGVAGAEYVGHPYFDEVADRVVDAAFVSQQRQAPGKLIALLPGSRSQEIERNLPMMLRAAGHLHPKRPDARFVVACLREKHAERARELIAAQGLEGLPIEIHHGKTAEILQCADLAWSVSGSVSLELMAAALPTVIVYKLNKIDLLIARPFIKSRYITLVNLLADAEVMPEYLTTVDVSRELASWALSWVNDPASRARTARALVELRDRVAQPGASERAAERIAGLVTGRREGGETSAVPAPHHTARAGRAATLRASQH